MELKLKDLEISSPAFSALETIPQRHTSDGENVFPSFTVEQSTARNQTVSFDLSRSRCTFTPGVYPLDSI